MPDSSARMTRYQSAAWLWHLSTVCTHTTCVSTEQKRKDSCGLLWTHFVWKLLSWSHAKSLSLAVSGLIQFGKEDCTVTEYDSDTYRDNAHCSNNQPIAATVRKRDSWLSALMARKRWENEYSTHITELATVTHYRKVQNTRQLIFIIYFLPTNTDHITRCQHLPPTKTLRSVVAFLPE